MILRHYITFSTLQNGNGAHSFFAKKVKLSTKEKITGFLILVNPETPLPNCIQKS